jgi:hypothetical protein
MHTSRHLTQVDTNLTVPCNRNVSKITPVTRHRRKMIRWNYKHVDTSQRFNESRLIRWNYKHVANGYQSVSRHFDELYVIRHYVELSLLVLVVIKILVPKVPSFASSTGYDK